MIALYGCFSASDGSFFISWAQCLNTKSNWGGIGCSTQSVPSLSNAVSRSAGEMESGPSAVAHSTTMGSLVFPSFQLASVSLIGSP
jgi:hypothetical protein